MVLQRGVALALRHQVLPHAAIHGADEDLVASAAEARGVDGQRIEARLRLLPGEHARRVCTLQPHFAVPGAGEEELAVVRVERHRHDAVVVPAIVLAMHFGEQACEFATIVRCTCADE